MNKKQKGTAGGVYFLIKSSFLSIRFKTLSDLETIVKLLTEQFPCYFFLIPSILLRSYNLTCKSNGQLMSYAQSRSQLQDWIWSILLHIKQNSNWLSLGTSSVFLMELINLVMQIYKLLARYQIICKIKCQFCLYFSAQNTRKYFWVITMIIFDMNF